MKGPQKQLESFCGTEFVGPFLNASFVFTSFSMELTLCLELCQPGHRNKIWYLEESKSAFMVCLLGFCDLFPFLFLVIVYFFTVLVSFLFSFGSSSVFLAMLVLKATPLICSLCVGFSWNWLNADKGQNCEKVDRSISSIFRLPVVFHKYCYLGNLKQVPLQLKLKNLLLLLLLCGDVAVN